jgi:hypothetical protein
MSDYRDTQRRLVWLYFWLLLFEGALRKWFAPGLSNVLLLVRDPVVIAIYALALRHRVFPASGLVFWTLVLAVACFFGSFAGVGNLAVTIYGLHADFLHLPLIFLLPRILQSGDIRKMGLVLLILLPPMALLAAKQFRAGPTSPWNFGAGALVGGQLFAAVGKVRASGTFSFATGLATYLALTTAFLLNDLLGDRTYPRWLILAAVPSLALALGVSGSRVAVLSVTIVCGLALYVAFRRPTRIPGAARFVLLAVMAVTALAWLVPVFNEGLAVHRQRFESGGGVRDGILVRYGQGFVAGARAASQAPVLGVGLGIGTNVGVNLLSGHREFFLGEGEWERVILESGPLLGLSFIGLRVAILLAVAGAALKVCRTGVILPLLLVGVGALDLITGQFGQPTTLGFAVFTIGLALAACETATLSIPARSPAEKPLPAEIRGRSIYAEQLHGAEEKGESQ